MTIELQQLLLRESRQRVMNENGLNPSSPLYGVFCVPYMCTTTIGDITAITPIPEYEEPEIVNANPLLSISASGVTREVINSGDADAQNWYAQRYNLYSDEETPEEILRHRTTIPLYIEQMAEIVALSGWLELFDYKDAPKILSAVELYLNELHHREQFSIHAIKPPEEDIQKLKMFAKVIKVVADRAMENGHYASTGMSSILQKLIKTQTVRSDTIRVNTQNEPHVEHMADMHGDIYDFSTSGVGIAGSVYNRSWEQ